MITLKEDTKLKLDDTEINDTIKDYEKQLHELLNIKIQNGGK